MSRRYFQTKVYQFFAITDKWSLKWVRWAHVLEHLHLHCCRFHFMDFHLTDSIHGTDDIHKARNRCIICLAVLNHTFKITQFSEHMEIWLFTHFVCTQSKINSEYRTYVAQSPVSLRLAMVVGIQSCHKTIVGPCNLWSTKPTLILQEFNKGSASILQGF